MKALPFLTAVGFSKRQTCTPYTTVCRPDGITVQDVYQICATGVPRGKEDENLTRAELAWGVDGFTGHPEFGVDKVRRAVQCRLVDIALTPPAFERKRLWFQQTPLKALPFLKAAGFLKAANNLLHTHTPLQRG